MIRTGTLGAFLCLTLGTSMLIGCDFALEAPDLDCDENMVAKVEALATAAVKLESAASGLRSEVAAACHAIGTAFGESVPNMGAEPSDADITASCHAAKAAVSGLADDVTIIVEGGRCTIDAEAHLSCEKTCQVDVTCNPGTVVSRCEPGELSGYCEGSCTGGAICQGTATLLADCSGSCHATCAGTCDGTAVDGVCAGRCEGTCSGSCTLAADAKIECGVNVTCKGGCTVAYKEPRCETELTPPSCQVDVDCEAGCRAQASFAADCVPPTVTVSGSIDLADAAALVAHLPSLVNGALIQGVLLAEAAIEVSQAYPPAAKAVAGLPQCLVFFAGDMVAAANASVKAATTVDVSVQASVSVTASAGITTF